MTTFLDSPEMMLSLVLLSSLFLGRWPVIVFVIGVVGKFLFAARADEGGVFASVSCEALFGIGRRVMLRLGWAARSAGTVKRVVSIVKLYGKRRESHAIVESCRSIESYHFCAVPSVAESHEVGEILKEVGKNACAVVGSRKVVTTSMVGCVGTSIHGDSVVEIENVIVVEIVVVTVMMVVMMVVVMPVGRLRCSSCADAI
jgi:hypothetical protein